MSSPTIPTVEDFAKVETPSLEHIERLSKDISNSLSSKLSENAQLRAALEIIKETSYDSEAVEVAERALE